MTLKLWRARIPATDDAKALGTRIPLPPPPSPLSPLPGVGGVRGDYWLLAFRITIPAFHTWVATM